MSSLSRRRFLSHTAFATAAAVLPTGASVESPAQTKPRSGDLRPANVLLIMSDQHMPAAMGAAGNTVVKTPNLDAFAKTGVMFDCVYCADPVCTPSRASLLTGLHVHHHHTPSNKTPWPFENKTLAHYLGRAGYMTALIGKMHFVDGQTHGFDVNMQFNDWYQQLGPKTRVVAEEILEPNSGSGLPQIDALWENGDPWTGHITRDDREGYVLVGRPSELDEQDHFESYVARESIRFLKVHGKEQPFFLCSSFLKPHNPFTPAVRFANMYHSHEMKLPETWGKVDLTTQPKYVRQAIITGGAAPEVLDIGGAQKRVAAYYGCVTQMDDCTGKLLKALEELELERDTIVVYTSDHGDMLGNRGMWEKNFFYEQSVRVPLIVRVPGVTQAGARCASPISQVQMVATLLQLCGIEIPGGLDGRSFVPCLRNPSTFIPQDILAEREMFSPRAGYMLRSGDLKYCYSVHDMPELYDLKNDPEEMKNLALLPVYSGKCGEMKAKLSTMAPMT